MLNTIAISELLTMPQRIAAFGPRNEETWSVKLWPDASRILTSPVSEIEAKMTFETLLSRKIDLESVTSWSTLHSSEK